MATARILYAVTFDATEAAVSWQVAELAKACHAPVVLLGARRRRRWKLRSGNGEDVGRKLAAIATRLKGYVADIRVTEDPLPEAAMRTAGELGAELIVVSAGARAMQQPTHVSDDGLAIARNAHQDVWICKPFADPYIGHVLCAADTTLTAGAAVTRSVKISRRFNALLRILSVMPEPLWKSAADADDPEEQMREQHEAQKAFLDQFDMQGVPLSRAIVWARDAAVEVLDEAERYAEGLLVIGASSRAPLPQGQLGPTSESILTACPSSLLIVKKRMPASVDKKKERIAETAP